MKPWWILGHGQVAHALIERLSQNGVPYHHGSARDIMASPPSSTSENYAGAVLATTDASISPLAESIQHLNLPMLHLSGATSIEAIPKGVHGGVWWPMQSFHLKEIPWGHFPTFVESNSPEAEAMLAQWQLDLGLDPGIAASSDTRRDYHLGAVFANNFSNHLIGVYKDFFRIKGLNREVFDDMLRRTVERALGHDNPHAIQSGPAYRGESDVIDSHRQRLPDELKVLFDAFTQSIQNHAK